MSVEDDAKANVHEIERRFAMFSRVKLGVRRVLLVGLVTILVGLLVGLPLSQQSREARFGTEAVALEGPKPEILPTNDPYTLNCFLHTHVDINGNTTGAHIGVYTITWEVTDGSLVSFQLASAAVGGIPCPGGVITLTFTGAAAGAIGFNTFTCNLTEQQACTLNIPVASGGSVSGFPGQPTFAVPAGHTAVLRITTDVPFLSSP